MRGHRAHGGLFFSWSLRSRSAGLPWIVQNWFHLGFVVDGFWAAFWGGIIISVVSFLINLLLPEEDERGRRSGARSSTDVVGR